MKWIAWLLLPFALLAREGHASDATESASCEKAYASLPDGAILDLLDTDAPMQRRTAALSAYERLAPMTGCPEFGYTLGQLYRHGEYLPGNLVEQDLDKARTLIRPMAENGYLAAFADLAEMEMRHANAREAMKWTQVYLHFVDKVMLPTQDPDGARYQRSAYNGNLLNRVELIWFHAKPRLSRKLVKQDLNAYLDAMGEPLLRRLLERRDGHGLRASAQDGGPIRIIEAPRNCHVNHIDRIGAASAAWIVEVLPSGETGRVVLENFVPRHDVSNAMAACLARYAFAPFDGDKSATIRIPMVMGSTEGAAIGRLKR